jgi:hypothetical protein
MPQSNKSVYSFIRPVKLLATTRELLFCRGSLSAGSHTGCAPKAMIVVSNGYILQFVQSLNVKDGSPALMNAIDAYGIAQLCIEIAIINLMGREQSQTW